MLPLSVNDPRGIGRYRLLASLGQGGMGQVHLAIGPDGGRLAVKRILPHLANDPDFRQRFAKEVDAARQVAGPHTVPVVDADTGGAQPWCATEFVPGPTLSEALDQEGPLPEAFVRTLGVRLTLALGSIHAAGLVHRDIKPSNVLLSPGGPKLLDFGISRAMDYSTSSALTQTGGVVGSPGYMSPEQAESKTLTYKSDIFSLGCLLATAVTGRAVFEGPSIPQVLYKVVHGEPDLEDVPDSLKEPIARCLSKDPEDRPTAVELSESLAASSEVATSALPVVRSFVAHQESQIAALWSSTSPNPTLVDNGPTMVYPRESRAGSGVSARNKAIIAAVAALALALLIAIPLATLLPDSSSEGDDSAGGDAVGDDGTGTEASLEMPSDVCEVLDLDGLMDLAGSGARVEKEPESSTEGDVFAACSVHLRGDDMTQTSLSIHVATSGGGGGTIRCFIDGCGSETPDMPDGESEERPWDKGAILDPSGTPKMVWYQGDFTVGVTALMGLDEGTEAERDFLLDQGIAVYDHMEK